MTALPDPVATDSARDRFDRLHEALRERICLLDYAPGTRLSEEALAEEFGISRTPLRRVLTKLEAEGLVRAVHGVGTFVTDVDLEALAQTYQLRLELTGLTARLDPVPPDAALWARFRAAREAVQALVTRPNPRGFARLNLEFFRARLALTANEPLREICEALYLRTARIWLMQVLPERIDLVAEVALFAREIDDVLEALELGDLTAAADIQRAHIAMSLARLRRARAPGQDA